MLWQNGQKLNNGNYMVDRILGQGRFSVTYLAKEVRTNGYVAIKTLNPDASMLKDLKPSEREKYATKFYDEALKLSQCQHPHIVKVREIFDEAVREGWFANTRYPCIVMDYIDGVSLGQRGEPQLPEKIALGYIQQIGSALISVHQRGLLHRDLKPGNIMIRAGKQEAILIDFGLARSFDHPLTQQITVDGFAPFELYSHLEPKGPWTDVYSLAATLYVLLTGKKPESALDRHDTDSDVHLTPPRLHNPKISQKVNQAIVHAMALIPGDRTQSVPEFLRELGIGRWSPIPQWDSLPIALQLAATVAGILGAIATIIALFLNK
ncbi:serine/threonine protein kinase [Arthrospira platensis BEA 1257B]